eukprot:4199677-Pyramimonas_sp.AAC.1
MIKECISDFMKQEPARGVGHAGTQQQQTITDKRMITAVVGNLDGIPNLPQASKWLEEKLVSLGASPPRK